MELRGKNGRVLFHERERRLLVLEIQHVPQLVDLVVGDHLDPHELLHVGLICLRTGHDGNACTREGDLGGRGELKDHIGIARLTAECQDIFKRDEIALKLMDTVGVVPHEHKVLRRGLHICDAMDGLIGVDDAVGIRVLRHAPHALDRRVLYQLFDHVHIGSRRGHGDRDHLEAERLRNFEMAVIARRGAEPLHAVELAPRLLRMQHPVRHSLGYRVIHERQRRAAANKALLRLAAQNVGKQPLRGRKTRKLAVVANVHTVAHALLRAI